APFFAGSGGAQFRRLWLDSVYEHARFIHGYFSRHSSANNHLIGEAAGLYIAGLTWPCWPTVRDWRQVAQQILEREALLQSSTDGANLEQTACYQQFVLDFLLLALLPGGGYYILGCDFETAQEIRLVADAGPLGYRTIAAHGHADALAFTLSLGGLEFLIDPGTYAYHGGGEWRAYFRGTAAHNTLRID